MRGGTSSRERGVENTMVRRRQDASIGRRPRRRRWLWRIGAALLIMIVIGVTARVMLPSYLRRYVNRVLDQSSEYDGRIGRIDVRLLRGEYAIHDVQIVKTDHSVPVPFFESRKVDFSLDWNSLWQGKARGKIIMERPRLNFVDGPTEEETQTGAYQPWLGMIDQLFPFRIDKAEIKEGEVHFHTFHVEPEVDVYLSDVQATITNLTNVEDKVDPLIANVTARGTAMDTGRFRFRMDLDPRSYRPTFDLALQLLDVDVTRLDALTHAYGNFDFEEGQFDLVIEAAARNGFVDGNVKPLFRNLKVLSIRDFKTDNPFQIFWEAVVGLTSTVFKNQSRDQFGTSFAIQGDIEDPRTNILEMVGNVLRNAFIQAYLPRLDRRIERDLAGDGRGRREESR
jgi:hypothetical protein